MVSQDLSNQIEVLFWLISKESTHNTWRRFLFEWTTHKNQDKPEMMSSSTDFIQPKASSWYLYSLVLSLNPSGCGWGIPVLWIVWTLISKGYLWSPSLLKLNEFVGFLSNNVLVFLKNTLARWVGVTNNVTSKICVFTALSKADHSVESWAIFSNLRS